MKLYSALQDILSFGGTAEECGTRPNGIVVLSGLIEGRENVASDDDVIYTGTLQMIVEIDICSAKRQAWAMMTFFVA